MKNWFAMLKNTYRWFCCVTWRHSRSKRLRLFSTTIISYHSSELEVFLYHIPWQIPNDSPSIVNSNSITVTGVTGPLQKLNISTNAVFPYMLLSMVSHGCKVLSVLIVTFVYVFKLHSLKNQYLTPENFHIIFHIRAYAYWTTSGNWGYGS